MKETKQILDAIFASADYTVEEYLADLGIKPQPPQQRLLTNKQACRYLQISPTTLWRLVKRGKLKAVQFAGRARYDIRELDRLIRRHQA